MGSKSPSTVTTTTSPPAAELANYTDVTNQAKSVAATPYQAYNGQLVAGINDGQQNAIGELQSGFGVANPYLNSGSSYLGDAAGGLGNVQNYLQTASGLGNISGYQGQAQNNLGEAAGAYAQGQAYSTPQQFSQSALQQYMSPYTQGVINSTMANAQQQDAIQSQQLSSNAIGQGAYGGDRAGIAQSSLAGQQDLANNQTIAGLENQGYSTALGQYNQNQANQFQAAGLANAAGQGYSSLASQYGNLGSQQLQQAGLYNTLGQTQGQAAQLYGGLAGTAGNLGQIAQNTSTAGASAALQASTLQQQNQQQQDAAAYGQYQAALQYPFQTTSYLANIDEGIGANSGGSTTSPGASTLSQVVGAGTAGLGILGAIGGSGGASAGLSSLTSGLSSIFSDKRLKEDIEPIGKTFSGDMMYRFRYKGDPTRTMHTGLMAQEVEKRTPHAVSAGLGGAKMVDYSAATDKAAERGHYARGGGLVAPGGPLFRSVGEGAFPYGYGPRPYRSDAPAGLAGSGQHMGMYSSAARPADDGVVGRALHLAGQVRGGYARGGLVGTDIMGALTKPLGFNGSGGPLSNRSLFADGGGLDDSDTTSGPALSFTAPAAWGAGGLTGGVGVLGAAPAGQPGHQAGLGVGGAGGAPLPILHAQPVAQSPQPQAGLGAAAGFGSPPSGSSPSGSGGATDNDASNRSMAILAAGLGIMGGTSPFAAVNIGQGALAGLRQYQEQRQNDRANAIAQSDIAYKQGTLGLEQSKLNLSNLAQLNQINSGRAAVGLPPLSMSDLTGGSGGVSPSSGGQPAPGLASGAAPSGPEPGLAPSTVAAPAAGGLAPSSGGSAPSSTNAPAGMGAVPALPAPGSTTGSDFWSGVDPNSNPYVLNQRANAAQAYGNTQAADALRTQASNIFKGGVVPRADGSLASIPGYTGTVSAQKTAEAQGEEAGKTQTVYDPDGNPILVPGATYQQIARNGGGQVNGVPVTGGQSPYMKATVENNAEFNKDAISFNKDYQQNVYALGSLAHIYQSYQGGRGADAVADLDSLAKQGGFENLLPKGWQNAAGGFDAAYKTAVDQSFKTLAESGATKAPATGLREALLTTPRPDADPAARYKVITDKLAALSYSHDLYGSFLNGNDPNVGRSILNFQKSANYGDYVNAARSSTPLPAGMSPSAARMVLGPTGGSGSSVPGQAAPNVPMAGPSASAPGQPAPPRPVPIPSLPASVPPGSAYSPSRNMWRAPNGTIFDATGKQVS